MKASQFAPVVSRIERKLPFWKHHIRNLSMRRNFPLTVNECNRDVTPITFFRS